MLGLERVPGRERDRADARALARSAQVGRGADTEDADAADVAFEQGVHGLRRREGDERDAAAVLAELVEQLAERVGDALRNAARASCEVGTTACASSRSGAVSIATAFVNVPPTSTPIRIARLTRCDRLPRHGAAPRLDSEHPGGAEDVDDEQRPPARSGPRGWDGCRSAPRGRRAAAPSRLRPA